jgi:hypothetical protein
MTLPFVESGEAKKVGEFHAPWSSFLIVASDRCIETQAEQLKALLDIIENQVTCFLADSETPAEIHQQFKLSEQNAKIWLSEQQWHHHQNTLSKSELENAMQALNRVGINMSQIHLEDLYAPWIHLTE